MGIFDRGNDNQQQQQHQQQGHGMFSGRLLAALFIGVVGCIMYMSQVQENPITDNANMLRFHLRKRLN